MDDAEFSLAGIDFDLLLRQLTATASTWFAQQRCFNSGDMLSATGQSAIDLTYDAVAKFLGGGIAFHPKSIETTQKELFLLLRRVMRNDFLDLVKDGRAYKRTAIYGLSSQEKDPSEDHAMLILDNVSSDEPDFQEIDKAFAERQILVFIGQDKELVDYVRAVLYGNCIKREDIADFLNITPQETTNRQRRLRNKLVGWRNDLP